MGRNWLKSGHNDSELGAENFARPQTTFTDYPPQSKQLSLAMQLTIVLLCIALLTVAQAFVVGPVAQRAFALQAKAPAAKDEPKEVKEKKVRPTTQSYLIEAHIRLSYISLLN
jgi:hypothetical protein